VDVPPNASRSETWIREELLHLLSVSGTLAGFCVTVVAVVNTIGKSTRAATVVDDVFAMCALLFLVCTYLTFTALRTTRPGLASLLTKVVDALFLIALTVMITAAFLMVYTVW
jgi:hypothetical protein